MPKAIPDQIVDRDAVVARMKDVIRSRGEADAGHLDDALVALTGRNGCNHRRQAGDSRAMERRRQRTGFPAIRLLRQVHPRVGQGMVGRR